MEFEFNVARAFGLKNGLSSGFVKVDHKTFLRDMSHVPSYLRDRNASENPTLFEQQCRLVIDKMGKASARAQGLSVCHLFRF